MKGTGRMLVGAAAVAVIFASSPATAETFDFLWPASTEELGPVTWSGLIIKPDLGSITMEFSGTGGDQLGDAEGFSAGGEIGYDRQFGSFVVGGTLNLLWSGAEGDQSANATSIIESELAYYGTARARLGYAFDRFLIFGTGGGAVSNLEINNKTIGISDDQDLLGWVAGCGVEWRYNELFSIRGEFQHVEFEDAEFNSLDDTEVGSTMTLFKFGMVRRF